MPPPNLKRNLLHHIAAMFVLPHLVFFVSDVVDRLDLSEIEDDYLHLKGGYYGTSSSGYYSAASSFSGYYYY